MTAPTPPTSPWVWETFDYRQRPIGIEVRFDDVTRALTGATVYRDPECVYTTILIGTGEDGIPDNSPDAYAVPAGTTEVPLQVLRRNKLRTIEDVLALQITAGT